MKIDKDVVNRLKETFGPGLYLPVATKEEWFDHLRRGGKGYQSGNFRFEYSLRPGYKDRYQRRIGLGERRGAVDYGEDPLEEAFDFLSERSKLMYILYEGPVLGGE